MAIADTDHLTQSALNETISMWARPAKAIQLV
jgi:hypothetical protein